MSYRNSFLSIRRSFSLLGLSSLPGLSALLVACGPTASPEEEAGEGSGAGTGSNPEGSAGARNLPDEVPAEEEKWLGRLEVVRILAHSFGPNYHYLTFRLERENPLPPSDLPPLECERIEMGGCTFEDCEPREVVPGTTNPEPEPPIYPTAGEITMLSTDGLLKITGTQREGSSSYEFERTGEFLGGEILQITTTGGSIDPISTTLALPFAPILLAPIYEGSPMGDRVGAIPFDGLSDVELKWDSRGEEGRMVVYDPAKPGGILEPHVKCNYDIAEEEAVLPKELLARLPAGYRLSMMMHRGSEIETPQGKITVLVGYEVVSEDRQTFPILEKE